MPRRPLVSAVAGALVVAGGWVGWSRPTQVQDAVASAAEAVLPPSMTGETPAPDGTARATGPLRRGQEVEQTQARGTRDAAARRSEGVAGDPTRTDDPGQTQGGRQAAATGQAQEPITEGDEGRDDGGDEERGAGPSVAGTGTDDDRSGGGSRCTEPAPSSASAMNAAFRGMDRLPTLEGGDHGGSVRLADGRRLFTFGDTIRADSVSPFMVRNSVLVLDGACLTAMSTPGDGPAIPKDGTVGYWPMSMRAVPDGDGTTVQVITARVLGLGPGEFETLGSALATFEVPTGGQPRYQGQVPLGAGSKDPRVPTWGAAMWESGGQIYVFGTSTNAAKSTAGWSLRVARTAPGNLADPSAWQYWDGSSWSGDSSAAQRDEAALIPADGGVSHILSVFERGGSWYALSKEGEYFGEWLTVWKAPSPTGPYVKHRIQPLRNDSAIRRYTPLAHPDAMTDSGRLLVSYSQGPWTPGPFFTNPELYRPQFLEISLP